MSMHRPTCVSLVILATLALFTDRAGPRPLVAAEPWPAVGCEPSAAELKIHAALKKETRCDFVETPLEQVVQFLKESHDVSLDLDRKALDEVGIASNVPLTRNLKGISLESALRLLLRDLDLGFIVQDEVLLITTEEVIQNSRARSTIRVYKTQGLLSDGETPEALAMVLTRVMAAEPGPVASAVGMPVMMPGIVPGMPGTPVVSHPAGQEKRPAPAAPAAPAAATTPANAPPRIVPFRDLLIVRATVGQQEDLSRLLGTLAEARTAAPKRPAPAPQR